MCCWVTPIGDDTSEVALAVRLSGCLTTCRNGCSDGWTTAAREDQPCASGAMWLRSVSISGAVKRMDTNHSASDVTAYAQQI